MKRNTKITIAVIALFTTLTVPLQLLAQRRYKLIDIPPFSGGNNSYLPGPFQEGTTVASISNTGVFAGAADISTPDPFSPNCFTNDCLVGHTLRLKNGVTQDIGALPGNGLSSLPTWVGPNGLIVGFSENGATDPDLSVPEVSAVLWNNGNINNLGTLPGGDESIANAVNSSGQVVGYSTNCKGSDPGCIADPNSLAYVFGLWYSPTRAVLWQNGKPQDLGTLGGTDAMALFINEPGQIVGLSYTADSVSNVPSKVGCSYPGLTAHSFLWERGAMTDLGTLGGSCTFVYDLNDSGQAVGQSNLPGDQMTHPYIWSHGKIRDLHTLGGTYGFAVWLNNLGDVVGTTSPQGDLQGKTTALHATLWKHGAAPTDLGNLPEAPCSVGNAINSSGQIVGGSGGFGTGGFFPPCETTSVEHAVLWNKGQIVDLNVFVPPASNLTLNEASFINDLGEISGTASLPNGDTHAFLLVPCGSSDGQGCQDASVGVTAAATRQSTPRSRKLGRFSPK